MLRKSVWLALLAGSLASSMVASNIAPAAAASESVTASWCLEVVTFDFIQVPVGSSSQADIFFSNCGTIPANVTGFTLSGPQEADYTVVSDTCIGTPVQANSFCGVTVRFSPSATGRRDAVLTVASDALPTELPVLLTGEGLATTDLAVMATSRSTVPTGHDVVVNVVVRNLGPDTAPSVGVNAFLPGRFQSVSSPAGVTCAPPPPDFDAGFIGCDIGSLASGASVTLEVRITILASGRSTLVTEWIVAEFSGTCGCARSYDPDRANNVSRQEIRVVGKRG